MSPGVVGGGVELSPLQFFSCAASNPCSSIEHIGKHISRALPLTWPNHPCQGLAECEVVEGTIEFSRTPDLSPFDQRYHTSQNKSIEKKKYLLSFNKRLIRFRRRLVSEMRFLPRASACPPYECAEKASQIGKSGDYGVLNVAHAGNGQVHGCIVRPKKNRPEPQIHKFRPPRHSPNLSIRANDFSLNGNWRGGGVLGGFLAFCRCTVSRKSLYCSLC